MNKEPKKLKMKDIKKLEEADYEQMREAYYMMCEGMEAFHYQYRNWKVVEREAFGEIQKAMHKLDHLANIL